MLIKKLTTENTAVEQAENAADVLIIEKATEQLNALNTTVVVSECVDLLVLLTARIPTDTIIYFLKHGYAQQQTEIYSMKSLSAYLKCQNDILMRYPAGILNHKCLERVKHPKKIFENLMR